MIPRCKQKIFDKILFPLFFFRWWTFHYIILFFLNHQSPKRKLKKNVQIIENEKISQTKWRNEGCRVISSFRSQHISFVLAVSAVNILVEDFWTLFSGKNKCYKAATDFLFFFMFHRLLSIFSSVTLNVTICLYHLSHLRPHLKQATHPSIHPFSSSAYLE